MSNPFLETTPLDLMSPGRSIKKVTASDTADLPDGVCRAIIVGVTGSATIDFVDAMGNDCADFPVNCYVLPVGASRIKTTGTAVNIWAVY